MQELTTYQFQLNIFITRFSYNQHEQFYEERRKSTSFCHREKLYQERRSIDYSPSLRGSAEAAAIQENGTSAVKVEHFHNWFAASPFERLLAMTKIRRGHSAPLQKQCGKIMTTSSQIYRQ